MLDFAIVVAVGYAYVWPVVYTKFGKRAGFVGETCPFISLDKSHLEVCLPSPSPEILHKLDVFWVGMTPKAEYECIVYWFAS